MRLLLTGAHGFTAHHLGQAAVAAGHEVLSFDADLTDADAVSAAVAKIQPTHVLHLAAISAVTHGDATEIYAVNVVGTVNLLTAIRDAAGRSNRIERVVLASSANVYGNATCSPIPESCAPSPLNHYACSKLAMEHMAATFADDLPIVLARPFNYTGPGHDDRFVIPKLIAAFAQREDRVELGNLDVEREFNDVRMVVAAYFGLLARGVVGETYNICSGLGYSLRQMVATLESITGHQMELASNPAFVRANEVMRLVGDPSKVQSLISDLPANDLPDLLAWMLRVQHDGGTDQPSINRRSAM